MATIFDACCNLVAFDKVSHRAFFDVVACSQRQTEPIRIVKIVLVLNTF